MVEKFKKKTSNIALIRQKLLYKLNMNWFKGKQGKKLLLLKLLTTTFSLKMDLKWQIIIESKMYG